MATLLFQVMKATLGDVIEARLALEPVMARLAAERRDPASNDELRLTMNLTRISVNKLRSCNDLKRMEAAGD